MKFSLKNLKKQLIVKWGFSYVMVISIMLLAVLMISYIYNSTSKKYLNEFNDYIFETVKRDTNDTLLSMNKLCSSITQNTNLLSMLSVRADLSSENTSYAFIDDLRALRDSFQDIDNFFVYFKDTDTVISPSGIYSSYLYYTINFNPDKISFEDWKKTISQKSGQIEYSSMPFKGQKGENINSVSLLFSIPYSKRDCVGVILSNEENFVKGLENIYWDNRCDIYIYNSIGKLVIYNKQSSDEIIPRTLKKMSLIDTSKNAIHSSSFLVNSQAWQIITVVSNRDISRGFVFIQLLIIGIIILSLIIIFYLVKNTLSKNYRPIKTMLSYFNITSTENEYENLLSSINSALNQNESLTKELDSHTKKLRKLNLAKFLRGEAIPISSEGAEGILGKSYLVVTFYLDDISSLFRDDESLSDSERFQYLSFIVDNVISEILGQENICVNTTEMDGLVVCLITSEEKMQTEEIEKHARFGLDFINKSFDITLTFAISGVFENMLDIPLAYTRTTQTLEHQRVLGIKEPMQYIDITPDSQNKYIFDLHKEQLLVNSIKTGNLEAALEVLDQIFCVLQSRTDLPFDYIVYVVLDIASTITKTANSILPMGLDVNDSLVIYKKIKNGENLSNLHAQMIEYIKFYCETIKNDLKEGKNRTQFLVSHIEKYIQDNYSDPNLTVYSIGLHFNIKADYISKIFKKEIGKPLLTYITQYRVERALELTKEGKYSKKEIAEMVGFTSERNFYRVLKKYEEGTN